MKILHITSVTNLDGNGVAVAVSNYYKYEKELTNVAIYNLEGDVCVDGRSYSCSEYGSISALPDGFASPDLVIFNEVYKPAYLKLYRECLRKGIPYVIIPHGCLTENSQKKKKIKKMIANVLLFGKFVKCSRAIQYLNEYERDHSVMNKHRSIISGNGICDVKKENECKNKDFVFIGRYNIKHKGLDLIVKIASNNKNWFMEHDVMIKLYGRSSCNGYNEIKKMVSLNGVEEIIEINDAVYDKAKERILLESYAFVQPSRYEGQPIGIMEALSYGLPCIATYETSFGNYVNDKKCGIGIHFDEKELFEAIKKMFEDEEFRNKCSGNAIIVRKDYEWGNVMKKCMKEYEALL